MPRRALLAPLRDVPPTTKCTSHPTPTLTLRRASRAPQIGGISGIFTLNPLAMIISIYNVLFGVLIVLTELKTWPIIKTFQRRVDHYFHLLSVPRGKGGFYCFIGFLAFCSSSWDKEPLARACELIVTIVGALHLLQCKRCTGEADAEGAAQGMQPVGGGGGGGGEGATSWQGLMKEVVSDSPEVTSMAVTAGIQYAVTTGGGGFGGGGDASSAAASGGGNGGEESGIDGGPKSTMQG